MVLLAACGDTGNAGTLTGTQTAGTPTATPATAKHFHVGDTVTVGSTWKVVINSVKTNPGDGQFNIPKGQYVLIDITLTNTSNQEQNLSALNFKMRGTDGTEYTDAFVSGLAGVSPEPTGKVEAGLPAKGDFAYDVPKNVTSFTFAFSPEAFSSGATVWDLNL